MSDPTDDKRNRSATAVVLGLFMVTVLGLLLVRHAREIRYRDQARAAFEREATRIASVWRYRAPLTDRYDNPLNTTIDEYALAAHPSRLRELRHTRRHTLDLVEQEVSKLAIDLWPGEAQYRRVPRQDLEAHLLRASPMPFILWRDLDRETLQRWLLVRDRYPGIALMRFPRRIYHLPDLAPLVRGRIFLTREGVPGGPRELDFPDLTMGGWLGLERWRDATLRGEPGLDTIVLDAVMFRQGTHRTQEPRSGLPVSTTLDMTLQQWAQEALAGLTGGLVIMQTDGEILAMANADAERTPLRLDDAYGVWNQRLHESRADSLNRCLADPTGPGSIMKLAVALAALEAGTITPETTFECQGYVAYSSDSRIRCHRESGHGVLNLYEAIRSSCNCYFLQVAASLGWEPIAEMMWAMGLGQAPGEGLPDPDGSGSILDEVSATGSVHTPVLKQHLYQAATDRIWRPIDTGLMAIGQANMRVTVLQAAVYANCIASGRRVRPRITRDEPYVSVKLPVSVASREAILQGMQQVVQHPRGTATSARVPGTVLAGKTGTFERGGGGQANKDVWMIMLYPGTAGDTRLVIAAMAHGEDAGGRALGYRLAELVTKMKEWETWPQQRRRQWPTHTPEASVAQAHP